LRLARRALHARHDDLVALGGALGPSDELRRHAHLRGAAFARGNLGLDAGAKAGGDAIERGL
jgi:hypothetical protein